MSSAAHFDDLDTAPTVRGFAVGQLLFHRFRLDGILGRGGMGVVWLATDQQLSEPVALKVLPDAVRFDPAAMEALKEETRKSRRLTHRNIVRVHDFICDARYAAISMEWIDGSTLSVLRLKRPRTILEPEELGPMIRQVCDALGYAHESVQLVHRDLKPSNIFLGRGGEVKVTDFGICAGISATDGSDPESHAPASGTLVYISPQQARGEPPSIADDVYALGATVYEALTGKPPFYRGDIFAQVCEAVPPSIRARRAELGVRSPVAISPDLETVVAACLEKDPANRPRSVREVAAVFGPVKQAEPPQNVRTVTIQPARSLNSNQWAEPPVAVPLNKKDPVAVESGSGRKGLGWLLPLLLVALIAGGAAVWWWWQFGQPRVEVRQSQPPQQPLLTESEQPKGSARATREEPLVNSLGMKFVPVPGTTVLFSIWDTRRQDFEVFAKESGFGEPGGVRVFAYNPETKSWRWKDAGGTWKNPGYEQTADHPVVGISWEDAKAFCRWLTGKEHAQGVIQPDEEYRLPTSEEWTIACGEELYPWGSAWPPPPNTGNFRGEETKLTSSLKGYRDPYPRTGPVGSYAANAAGLFDMGGNVLQWCEDWYRSEMNDSMTREKYPGLKSDGGGERYRVLRGSSWLTVDPERLRSLFCDPGLPRVRLAEYGFRCVLVPSKAVRNRMESEAARRHEDLVEKEKRRRAEEVRPKKYTVPDDFKTIQEALLAAKAGDAVELRAGTYSESLVLKSGVQLRGAGANLVKVISSADRCALSCVDCPTGQISGIKFARTGTNSNDSRIPLISLIRSNVELENCWVQNGIGCGVFIHNASPAIGNCTIRDNGGSGILVDGSTSEPVIKGNSVQMNANYGICIRSCKGGKVDNNTVEQNNWSGIAVEAHAPALRIENNKCHANLKYGILFLRGASGSATHNLCWDNKRSGIGVAGPKTSPVVDDNEVQRNAEYGIIIDQRATPKSVERNNFGSNGLGLFNRPPLLPND